LPMTAGTHVHSADIAALKFCFKTCVAMKFVDDDDDDDIG